MSSIGTQLLIEISQHCAEQKNCHFILNHVLQLQVNVQHLSFDVGLYYFFIFSSEFQMNIFSFPVSSWNLLKCIKLKFSAWELFLVTLSGEQMLCYTIEWLLILWRFGNETVNVFNNSNIHCMLTSFPGNFQMPQHLILKRQRKLLICHLVTI